MYFGNIEKLPNGKLTNGDFVKPHTRLAVPSACNIGFGLRIMFELTLYSLIDIDIIYVRKYSQYKGLQEYREMFFTIEHRLLAMHKTYTIVSAQ